MNEIIYLTGAGCEYIKGPFRFPANGLKIERRIDDEFTVISNEAAGFPYEPGYNALPVL